MTDEKRSRLKTAGRLVFILIQSTISFLFLFFAVTSAFWGSAVLVLWFTMMATLAILYARKEKALRLAMKITLALWACFTLVFGFILWEIPFDDLQRKMKYLHQKSVGPGPRSLTTVDCLAIYTGNLAMGFVGYGIGFKEVAWETMRMALPGPKEHVIESDFAMKSEKVRKALGRFSRSLPDGDSHSRSITKAIGWTDGDYASMSYNEARVSLAVNCPFRLKATARKEQGRWMIDCRGSCVVAYKRLKELVPFFRLRGRDFYISEAMFWALRKRGWMYPFRVTYTWSLHADDKRLAN